MWFEPPPQIPLTFKLNVLLLISMLKMVHGQTHLPDSSNVFEAPREMTATPPGRISSHSLN